MAPISKKFPVLKQVMSLEILIICKLRLWMLTGSELTSVLKSGQWLRGKATPAFLSLFLATTEHCNCYVKGKCCSK